MKKRLLIIMIMLMGALGGTSAHAAGFEFLGQHGDWDLFADHRTNPSICYIGSKPTRDEGNYTRRGEIYVLITRRKSEGFKDVVSFHQGYPLKSGREIQVTIGGSSHKLFASGETAWAYEGKDDVALVKAMRAGSTMMVKAQSQRGTDTKDTYSLSGITAAHNAMRGLCS